MNFEVEFPERPLHSRRDVIVKGLASALVLGGFGSRGGIVLAGVPGVTHGESPGVEEGPYWVDGLPERSDVRTDSTTGNVQPGLPLYLGLTISQLSDSAPYTMTPLVGARVDIWNANAQGVYSDEASESTTAINSLRGYQITNSHGVVNFLTIYPGWYSGRTPHVHIRIRLYNSAGTQTYNYCTNMFFNETITSQVFSSIAAYTRTSARDTYNSTDRVYTGSGTNGSPAKEAGDYLLLKLAANGTRAIGSFHIVIDPSDTANADPTNGVENTSGTGTGTGPGGGTPPTGTPPSGGGPGTTGAIVATPTAGTQTTTKSSSTKSKTATTQAKKKRGS